MPMSALGTSRARRASCSVGVSRGPPEVQCHQLEGLRWQRTLREERLSSMMVAPGSERIGQWSPARQGHWCRGGVGKPIPFSCCSWPAQTALGLLYLGVPLRGRHPWESRPSWASAWPS